jgi:8-hydroxy-5-deazaflavin:NADPH oxidoreductase
MKVWKIGIVGSGRIGGTIGTLLAKEGCEVFFSSRHPETLKDLVTSAGAGSRSGTVAEAIAFGDVIVLSLPLRAMAELDDATKQSLKGRIVIDTSNPYPERDGDVAVRARNDPGGMGVFVARLLPGARIVRAFNTVYFEDLLKTVNSRGEKIGIPIAGDDEEGVKAVVELVERAGLDPVVVGGSGASKSFDVGSPVYATSASAREIRAKLKIRPAGMRAA